MPTSQELEEMRAYAITEFGQLSLHGAIGMSYDPGIIGSFIRGIYRMAAWAVVSSTIIGILLGGALGFAGVTIGIPPIIAVAVGAVIGGVIGFMVGNGRAFALKLQAQILLIQAQIEMNTRSVWAQAEFEYEEDDNEAADESLR